MAERGKSGTHAQLCTLAAEVAESACTLDATYGWHVSARLAALRARWERSALRAEREQKAYEGRVAEAVRRPPGDGAARQ